MTRTRLHGSGLLLAGLLLASLICSAGTRAFNGVDLTGMKPDGEFSLTDHHGRHRSLADFRGKAVLLYFGYTRCPDVCPTTLSGLSQVMKLLGTDAARVQVLWVSVDPERDTQQLLSRYVPAFNPAFLGLRGTARETAAMAARFHIQYVITRDQGEVLVDHSSFGFLIDPRGRTRVKLGHELTPAQIAADVRTVLQGG